MNVLLLRCTHRWKLAPPNGPLSWARCRRCGERRPFNTSLKQDNIWARQPEVLVYRYTGRRDEN